MAKKAQTHEMPDHQRRSVQAMDSGEIIDFQLRLQIECGMSHKDAAEYIAQAFETVQS